MTFTLWIVGILLSLATIAIVVLIVLGMDKDPTRTDRLLQLVFGSMLGWAVGYLWVYYIQAVKGVLSV